MCTVYHFMPESWTLFMEETHACPHPQFRIETCFVQMKRDKHKLRKCKNMNSGARQMHFNVKLWVVNISCKNWLQRLSPEQENTSSFCKIGGKMCEKDLVMHPFKGTSTSQGCVCSSYNTQSHGQIHRKCLAKQKICLLRQRVPNELQLWWALFDLKWWSK